MMLEFRLASGQASDRKLRLVAAASSRTPGTGNA
jgi:hypothetical protein